MKTLYAADELHLFEPPACPQCGSKPTVDWIPVSFSHSPQVTHYAVGTLHCPVCTAGMVEVANLGQRWPEYLPVRPQAGVDQPT